MVIIERPGLNLFVFFIFIDFKCLESDHFDVSFPYIFYSLCLGEGLTGTVYLAENSLTGGQVAIRRVQLDSLPWVGRVHTVHLTENSLTGHQKGTAGFPSWVG